MLFRTNLLIHEEYTNKNLPETTEKKWSKSKDAVGNICELTQ